MSHATILGFFYASLVIVLLCGPVLMLVWARRVFPRLMGTVRRLGVASAHGVAQVAFFYMIPGLLMMLVCAVPAFYFGHLLRQERHIVGVIQMNRLPPGSPHLDEYREQFDVPALWERAQREKPEWLARRDRELAGKTAAEQAAAQEDEQAAPLREMLRQGRLSEPEQRKWQQWLEERAAARATKASASPP